MNNSTNDHIIKFNKLIEDYDNTNPDCKATFRSKNNKWKVLVWKLNSLKDITSEVPIICPDGWANIGILVIFGADGHHGMIFRYENVDTKTFSSFQTLSKFQADKHIKHIKTLFE